MYCIASFRTDLKRMLYQIDPFSVNVSLRATQKGWIRKEDFSTLFPTSVLSIPVAETRKGAARNEVGKEIDIEQTPDGS